jgi:hypothetical protein
MRKVYLFTNINDRNRGPVQEVVSPNENVCIYIDNEYYTVCTAVLDTGKTCTGCELNKCGRNHICSIKVKQGKYISPVQSLCNYNTLLKPIDTIMENL